MSNTQEFEKKTKELIDGLKSVCANYGLGNDGNEFKIITQVFLYKFFNNNKVDSNPLCILISSQLGLSILDTPLNPFTISAVLSAPM